MSLILSTIYNILKTKKDMLKVYCPPNYVKFEMFESFASRCVTEM